MGFNVRSDSKERVSCQHYRHFSWSYLDMRALENSAKPFFPLSCSWKIATRQLWQWGRRREGRLGLRHPCAWSPAMACHVPFRNVSFWLVLHLTLHSSSQRTNTVFSSYRKVMSTWMGRYHLYNCETVTVVVSFGQPQEGNRTKSNFPLMRCPFQQKAGMCKVHPCKVLGALWRTRV